MILDKFPDYEAMDQVLDYGEKQLGIKNKLLFGKLFKNGDYGHISQ